MIVLLAASLLYFALGINSINRWTITWDEGDHFSYALRSLQGHPEKVIPFEDGSCMPVSMINALPRGVEQVVKPSVKNDGGVQDITRGRYMTLAAGFLILILIYAWLSRIATQNAAVIGFALAALCPNIISQSSLVTTDAYAALFFPATLFFLHQWFNKPTMKNFIFFAVVFAFGFLVKQSLIILVPVCLAIMIIQFVRSKQAGRSLLLFALFCAINIVVLNIGFQFNYAGVLGLKSALFQSLNKSFLFDNVIAKILPTPFLQGIDEVMYMDGLPTGDTRNLPYIFFNGDYVLTKTAAKQFFFQTFIFKTPVVFLIGWIMCIIACIKSKRSTALLYISLLPLCMLLFFTFFVHSKVGVRHILIIYPFVIMSAAVAFSRLKIPWLLAIFGLHMIMIFTHRNNLLAYTNEFVWGGQHKIGLTGTVNLEYNQYNISKSERPNVFLYQIDSTARPGDTIRLQVTEMYHIPDTLNNKHRLYKNYSILDLDQKNIITAVKRTAQNNSNR